MSSPDKQYIDVNLKKIRIKGGDPFNNKGKNIDDKMVSGVYRVRVTGDYREHDLDKKQLYGHEREYKGKKYTQMAGYDIEFISELKASNPCSFREFLNFKRSCINFSGKYVIGYVEGGGGSYGLQEGSFTGDITNFERKGGKLKLSLAGTEFLIDIKKINQKIYEFFDSNGDGTIEYGSTELWVSPGGDVVSFDKSPSELNIEELKFQQTNRSYDSNNSRFSNFKYFFNKSARPRQEKVEYTQASEINRELGKAQILRLMEVADGGGAPVPVYKVKVTNSTFKPITVTINKDGQIQDVEGDGARRYNQSKVEYVHNNVDYFIGLHEPSDLSTTLADLTYDGSGANESDASVVFNYLSIQNLEMEPLKMYCISESSIKKFSNVRDLLGSELLAAYTDVTTYRDAIKKYQKEKLEFKGRQVDGIFGPKSYGAISEKDSAFYKKLMSAFAQDAGFEDNIDPATIASYYQPKYIPCLGRRRSSAGGVAERSGGTGGEGQTISFGGIPSADSCKKQFNELFQNNIAELKKRIKENPKFVKFLSNRGDLTKDNLLRLTKEYLKEKRINNTPECFLLNPREEGVVQSLTTSTEPSESISFSPKAQQFMARNNITGCSGNDWTKDDVFNLLEGIITGRTEGLDIGKRNVLGGSLVGQVLNPNKLRNAFKKLLRKKRKGIDIPPIFGLDWRGNEFYLKIIRGMSKDLAEMMNAFVAQDSDRIKKVVKDMKLIDSTTTPSLGRYCKTNNIRQDRARLFLGFIDMVDKNPFAVDSVATKYIRRGVMNAEKLKNVKMFDTTDVRYTQKTWQDKANNAHDKTSGNILNDLVKLSNHLDNINEKAFSDRIEEIILETLGEK